MRLAKRHQDDACRSFAAIGAGAPDHGRRCSTALCAEAAGRYAEVGDLYARARAFGPGFGGDVSRGLGHVASLRAGAEDVRLMSAR